MHGVWEIALRLWQTVWQAAQTRWRQTSLSKSDDSAIADDVCGAEKARLHGSSKDDPLGAALAIAKAIPAEGQHLASRGHEAETARRMG